MTAQGQTAWMDSLDPNFGRVADVWMRELLSEFGPTDHWYQLDGYFNGGTAPWMEQRARRTAAAAGGKAIDGAGGGPLARGAGGGRGAGEAASAAAPPTYAAADARPDVAATRSQRVRWAGPLRPRGCLVVPGLRL